MNLEKVDVLVIGAGPSGTAAAAMVRKSGLKAKVVEQTKFPRFVIGESLLPRCMDHLEETGFLEAVKAKGFQKKTGARFLKGDDVCDFDFSEQFTDGWNWTWQVPRAEFDQVLADELQKQGVDIAFETTVKDIEFLGGDRSITTVQNVNTGEVSQIEADFIIDSSGYGRVIPRLLNLDEPSDLPRRETLFTHVKDIHRPEGDTGNCITIVVHEKDVWIWVIPFSDGRTSVGFVGNPSFFEKFSGTPSQKLFAMIEADPILKERLGSVSFEFEPKKIDGYSVSIKQLHGDGFVLTGNATEFLDPVFSSGVTFALESGVLAGKLVSKKLNGGTVDWQHEFVDHMMQGVDTFRTYVQAWYDGSLQNIFFTKHESLLQKQQICSVLAGYVWDMNNPYVKQHARALRGLVNVVKITDRGAAEAAQRE